MTQFAPWADEHADHDRKLVQGDESSSDLRRGDLGDVDGRDVRGQTDADAAGHAENDEPGETSPAGYVRGQGHSHAGDDEQQAGQDQQLFSAVTVAQAARHERSQEAAHQGATGRPAFQDGGGQMELLLIEHLRAADDHPVVAEQAGRPGPPRARSSRCSRGCSELRRRFVPADGAVSMMGLPEQVPPAGRRSLERVLVLGID